MLCCAVLCCFALCSVQVLRSSDTAQRPLQAAYAAHQVVCTQLTVIPNIQTGVAGGVSYLVWVELD